MIVVFTDNHSGGHVTLRNRRVHGKDYQVGYGLVFFNVPQTNDRDRAIGVAASYLMDEYGENPFEERCAICCGRNFGVNAFPTLEAAIASTQYHLGWGERENTFGHNVRTGAILLVHADRLKMYDPADSWGRMYTMEEDARERGQYDRDEFNNSN